MKKKKYKNKNKKKQTLLCASLAPKLTEKKLGQFCVDDPLVKGYNICMYSCMQAANVCVFINDICIMHVWKKM